MLCVKIVVCQIFLFLKGVSLLDLSFNNEFRNIMQSACKRFRQYRISGKCESFPLPLVSLHSVQSISYFNLSLRLLQWGK